MRHTEPTRDQQLQPISNTVVLPPKTSEISELCLPVFNTNLDVFALPNFPAPLALLQLNPALLTSSLFPKAAFHANPKTFPPSATSPVRPNLPGKWNDSSKSSRPSGETLRSSPAPSQSPTKQHGAATKIWETLGKRLLQEFHGWRCPHSLPHTWGDSGVGQGWGVPHRPPSPWTGGNVT